MNPEQRKAHKELYETVQSYRRTGFVMAREIIGRLSAQLGLTVNEALTLGLGPGEDNHVADLIVYGRA